MNKQFKLSCLGFMVGLAIPFSWAILKTLIFLDGSQSFPTQLTTVFTASTEQTAMYVYLGLFSGILLAACAGQFAKASTELKTSLEEHDRLRQEAATQRELFESHYLVLDKNLKDFHQISSKIQMSFNLEDILLLCAEGLHEILGYERVNILMRQDGNKVGFVTAAGTDSFDITGVSLPLDPAIGVIYKCFNECKVFLVDDIAKCPEEFQMQTPYQDLAPLRSRCFILCPIVVKGIAVGAFGIDNKSSRRPLNSSDVDTIMLFADQVASAITRINLISSIDRLTSEMENSFAFMLSNSKIYSSDILNLKESVDSVADGTSIIASASEGIMASVAETSVSVNEISIAIEQVTHNLDHLTGIVHQSASAMEEINCTIKNIEQNAAKSYDISINVKQRADESQTVVSETTQSLAEIQSSVELSYSAIRRLVQNSSRIDGIIKVINDITKKTNLLALNAAIIASQAGEYGKSFGVVAEEIRNLSLQTGRSTGEITNIIEEITSESKTAADNITNSKQLVQRGVELGQLTGEALQAIYNSAAYSLDMTEQIKLATQEQSTSVQVVARSMEDISSMTTQIFSASRDQAKETRNIARSIETIKDMAHEMVKSTAQQVTDSDEIRRGVESVSRMGGDMLANMEQRRNQSAEVFKELESVRKNAPQS